MNILILASYYEQDKNIASVRWTNFAYRLAKRHRVDVLAETLPESNRQVERYQSTHGITVMRMNQKTIYEKMSEWVKKEEVSDIKTDQSIVLPQEQRQNFARLAARKVKNRFCLFADYLVAKQQKEYVLQQMKNDHIQFDVIISSAKPLRQFLLGAMLTKKLRCAWISDFRDLPFTGWSDPDDIQLQSKLVLKHTPLASATTLVSKGMCEAFIDTNHIPEKYAKKVYVLSNGYSQADATVASASHKIGKGKLKIVYTGTLYEGKQDVSLLFTAVAELVHESIITQEDLRFEYAGNSGDRLLLAARNFGIASFVHDHGLISRQNALKLQHEADLLLLLTWNTHIDRGILTGKMYEYILCKKPIICITSGTVPHSEASAMIRKYHLGIACETMTLKEDVAMLKQYLRLQLQHKQKGEELEYHADYDALTEFDYDQLAVKLENICLAAVKEKK